LNIHWPISLTMSYHVFLVRKFGNQFQLMYTHVKHPRNIKSVIIAASTPDWDTMRQLRWNINNAYIGKFDSVCGHDYLYRDYKDIARIIFLDQAGKDPRFKIIIDKEKPSKVLPNVNANVNANVNSNDKVEKTDKIDKKRKRVPTPIPTANASTKTGAVIDPSNSNANTNTKTNKKRKQKKSPKIPDLSDDEPEPQFSDGETGLSEKDQIGLKNRYQATQSLATASNPVDRPNVTHMIQSTNRPVAHRSVLSPSVYSINIPIAQQTIMTGDININMSGQLDRPVPNLGRLAQMKKGIQTLQDAIISNNDELINITISGMKFLGFSIIHCAVKMQVIESIKYLVEHKIYDINWKDVNGCTPLDCAMKIGNMGIIHYLRNNGATVNVMDRQESNRINQFIGLISNA